MQRIDPLSVISPACIELAADRPGWLVDGLWAAQGVGIIGGAPKCCKTWLALDLAISVATATDVLGRFHVEQKGPVLFYGAEDAPMQLRDRIEAIAQTRGLALTDLDLGLIVADSLRLDTERDRARLKATLDQRRPRLLVLDPLVRLHRIDENSAGEMSALLGELRAIQRQYRLAIALVHHLRKNAPRGQDGQSLRGSGDLHAWGDSNLYLRKRDRQIVLSAEHRSAPSPPPCMLELTSDPSVHLRAVDDASAPHDNAADIADRIVEALAVATGPITREALRTTLRARNSSIGDALVRLRAAERIERCDGGFRLRDPVPVPVSTQEGERNAAAGQRPSA
jgi:hypothetical protein